jgi:hypothetical protein
MADQPIGPILDGLGITIDVDQGDLIETALVISKCILADGHVTVCLSDSAGMSWLEQLGLIAAATQIVNDRPFAHPDSDD